MVKYEPIELPGRAKDDPYSLWRIGVIAVLLLFASDFYHSRSHPGLSINGDAIWGRDFVNVWSAGRLVLERKIAILYDPVAYQAWQTATFGSGIHDHNYSYPPISLLYVPIIGLLPYGAALLLWLSLSAGLFWLAARPVMCEMGLDNRLALLLPSTLICIWAGHYGLIVGALWLGAWQNMGRRPTLAGILFGLLAIKPHLAVLVPLVLIRKGHWKIFAVAAATTAMLVGLSVILFGKDLWSTYLGSTSSLQLSMASQPHTYFGLMMPTILPSLIGVGMPTAWAWCVQLLVASAVTTILLWRLPCDWIGASLAVATATFLVLPYGFNYDMTIVGLAGLRVLARPAFYERPLDRCIGGMAVALPPTVIFMNLVGLRAAPFIIGALFWRQMTR